MPEQDKLPKPREINPEHKQVLDKLRDLYQKSGAKLWYKPEDWGLRTYHKSQEGLEIVFDYGIPQILCTRDGCYTIMGSHEAGDTDKFWELLNEEFEAEVIQPKRNDQELLEEGPQGELEFQLNYSGPVVRIRKKK